MVAKNLTLQKIFFAALLFMAFQLLQSCKKEEPAAIKPCTQPAPPKVNNNCPVSIGDTVKFTAETISGASYQWTGPNGFSSTQQNPSFVFNTTNIGEYLVTVTVDECESKPYHSYVTSLDITATSDTGVVTGGKLNLNASYVTDAFGTPIGATYNWKGPNNFTATTQNINLTKATMEMAGTYSVTATYNGHSGKEATTKVVITPKATIASSNSTKYQVSIGGTLQLNCDAVAGASYTWKGPNGFTSSLQNPSISNVTKAAEGTYYLTYVLSGVTSKGSSTAVKIAYSNSGCGGQTTVTHNGITYNTVEIGTQCWTKENIKKGGISSPDTMSWNDMKSAGIAVNQGVCPLGWHLPVDTMWERLSQSVSGNGNALKALGEDSTTSGWATNTSGFSAILNLGKDINHTSATFWSASGNLTEPKYIRLNKGSVLINFKTGYEYYPNPKSSPSKYYPDLARQYSVRCIKD